MRYFASVRIFGNASRIAKIGSLSSGLIIAGIIAMISSQKLSAQKKSGKVSDAKEIIRKIYQSEILENFEEKSIQDLALNSAPSEWTLAIADLIPPPITESKKYLSMVVKKTDRKTLDFDFKEPLQMKKFVRSLSLWVYSNNYRSELRIKLMDYNGVIRSIKVSNLNFIGWRRVELELGVRYRQNDRFLNEKSALQIKGFELISVDRHKNLSDQFVAIDEIAAQMREKYLIPPELKKTSGN